MPLGPDILRMLRERMEPEYEEGRERFAREALGIDAEYSVKGMGRSGAVIEATDEAAGREVEARVVKTWNALRTILGATGIHYYEALADDLKSAVAECVDTDDLLALVKRRAESIGLSIGLRAGEWGMDATTPAHRLAIKRSRSDIDLYVLNLRRKVESRGGRTGDLIQNFYGPVGAVQMGAGSSATVAQQIGGAEKEALLKAVELVEDSLAAVEAAGGPRAQIAAELAECRTEIAKPAPNTWKVGGMLRWIATGIQTVADASPAYQAIKSVLALLGFDSPDLGAGV